MNDKKTCNSNSIFYHPKKDLNNIYHAIKIVKDCFKEGLTLPFIEDLAFIGNASDIYTWEPTRIIDLDICLIVKTINCDVGFWLQKVKQRLLNQLKHLAIKLEFRIVRGPYKPTPYKIKQPIILAHGAVFTEKTYLEEAPLLRWGWRKYKCFIEEERLKRLAPSKPSIHELLSGPKGIEERLANISRGEAIMRERVLPSLKWKKLEFGVESYLFSEYCFAAGANTARNHVRVLGKKEADHLPNIVFFPWYYNKIFSSFELMQLIELKKRTRQKGYSGTTQKAKVHAETYLLELREKLLSY